MNKLTHAIVAAGLALAGTSALAVNLVTNGSFESDTISGTYAPNFEYETSITGWTVSHPGSVGIVLFNKANYGAFSGAGTGYQGSDGTQAIQLERGEHSISQTLNDLVVGQQYLLSFDYASYLSPPNASFTYTVNGVTNTLTGAYPGWQTQSLVFTAAFASTVLTFASTSLASPNSYPHLDNVSVTAVPEPSAMVMMLAGMLAVGFVAARRRV